MHRPFVTTVKFENENGIVMRLEYADAAVDTANAKTELERRFLDLEVEHYTIERIVEATTLQARMLKLAPSCVMLLALNPFSWGNDVLSSAGRDLPNQ
jgi:hypothetical protein